MRYNCDKQEKSKTAFYNFSVKELFWNISQNLPTPVPVSFLTGIFTVIFAKIFTNFFFVEHLCAGQLLLKYTKLRIARNHTSKLELTDTNTA